MERYIGALDQGTTSTRFLIFDFHGNELGRAQIEHTQIMPAPGWVEHDPVQILTNSRAVMDQALQTTGVHPSSIASIGITNQRETTVVWDSSTGEPLHNAIVWQDMRTAEVVQQIHQRGLSDLIRQKTGLAASTYFSATKLQWLLRNVPAVQQAARKGRALFGTIDTWLIWNFTGGKQGGLHVTDVTNASRTMLMSLENLAWDTELLSLFEIPREMLPVICPSSDPTSFGAFQFSSNAYVPICGNLGDQQAALMGQVCFDPGDAKNTYGTGNFILMNTGTKPKTSEHGLLTTAAYRMKDQAANYALEGSVAVTGAAVQWLRDQFGMIRNAAEIETLALRVPDSGGVYFVPAFSGLFAPYWRTDARGVIVGLTRFSTREHLCRATLESICFQTRDVLLAMNSDSGNAAPAAGGPPLTAAAGPAAVPLKVDGGASVNNTLMQLQADITGVPVVRPKTIETTALGAAYAAGLAIGFWENLSQLKQNWQIDREWEPTWSEDQRETSYKNWEKAVQKSMDWVEG